MKEWKKAGVKQCEALVEESDFINKLREAELEFAKGSLVVGASGPGEAKYSVKSLQDRVDDAQKGGSGNRRRNERRRVRRSTR